MVLGALVLVLLQAGIGMAVNLYVTIPAHHPGAHPTNYLSGSYHSVIWAIGHGAVALAVHASLGLALFVMTVTVAIRALAVRRRWVSVWAVLAALLVIGAGFNGASFLDFNNNISSFIMTLLAFAAVSCYAVVLFLLSSCTGTVSAVAAGALFVKIAGASCDTMVIVEDCVPELREQGAFDSLKADHERWWRTHQKQNPVRVKARPRKIAVSYHWNGQ